MLLALSRVYDCVHDRVGRGSYERGQVPDRTSGVSKIDELDPCVRLYRVACT